MRRNMLIATLLAATLFAGGAAAQRDDAGVKLQDRVTAAPPAADTREVVIEGSGAADEWVGSTLVAADGAEVGTVREVVTDTDGAVREVHAEVGGFLGLFTDTVSIPVDRIMLEEDGRLFAEMSADEIKAAPRVEPGA